MESLYDVQQLLKRFGIIVYVGKRIWDIELMQIELRKLYDSSLVDRDTYMTAWHILRREHHIEEGREAQKEE
ncbi:YqgQ family protein [Enterococcus asini]|uniref:YqgQ family protein n=1 Tax=Enterococcus TaxID=1350 RepID=UPI00288ECB19|nr:YqgQ family protein [Enterococcus asini]MDT2756772.1 YqgQ family protein [Enterococcus asini]